MRNHGFAASKADLAWRLQEANRYAFSKCATTKQCPLTHHHCVHYRYTMKALSSSTRLVVADTLNEMWHTVSLSAALGDGMPCAAL